MRSLYGVNYLTIITSEHKLDLLIIILISLFVCRLGGNINHQRIILCHPVCAGVWWPRWSVWRGGGSTIICTDPAN